MITIRQNAALGTTPRSAKSPARAIMGTIRLRGLSSSACSITSKDFGAGVHRPSWSAQHTAILAAAEPEEPDAKECQLDLYAWMEKADRQKESCHRPRHGAGMVSSCLLAKPVARRQSIRAHRMERR